MKKPGYREMLRDRCPKMIDYALKWRKSKEKWIDHVYRHFIKIIGDEFENNPPNKLIRKAADNKKAVARVLLGIVDGKVKHFEFDKTIDWNNLTEEETKEWKIISSWVRWFRTNYAYIENTYSISKKTGKSDFDIRVEIINGYLYKLLPNAEDDEQTKEAKYKYVDSLTEFLINCFERKI